MDKIYQKLLVFIAFYSVVSMFFCPYFLPIHSCFPRAFHVFCHAFPLKDHEKEVDNRTVELEMLRERRTSVQEELQRLDQLRAKEAEDYKALAQRLAMDIQGNPWIMATV